MYRSAEDGTFHYVNPALVRMLGYARAEDVLALNLVRDIYVDPTLRPRLIAEYRAKGVIDGARVKWRRRDGSLLVVQIFGHVVEDANGVASFDASVLDITEREKQREELERTARTLELVVKQMPAVYWLVDHDLRIVSTGGAIAEVLGYDPERWVGSTLYDVQSTEPGSRDPIVEHKRALAGETVTWLSEYRGKQMNNTIAPFRRDGEIVGAIGTGID